MLKIIHCADLHLDAPMTQPKNADAFCTFQNIIRFTNEQKADLLLIAGDLFDSVYASKELIFAVRQLFSTLDARVFIAAGNHDYLGLNAPLSEDFGENVHIFSPGEMQCVSIGELSVNLYGSSFDKPHMTHSPLSGFKAKADDRIQIGVLHADADKMHSDYAPITTAQIAQSGLDYLALGHVHSMNILQTGYRTLAAYPGVPQAKSHSDTDGGVFLVTFSDGKMDISHHDLSVRHYLTKKVDISALYSDMAVSEAIYKALCEADDPTTAVFRAVLHGQRTPLYRPNLSAIADLLKDKIYRITVTDHSFFLPEYSENDYTLSGIFLKKMNALLAAAQTEEEREEILAAREYGLQAFYSEVNIHAD